MAVGKARSTTACLSGRSTSYRGRSFVGSAGICSPFAANNPTPTSMHFTKAHAYGNDFLYVEAAGLGADSLPAVARALCDRHTGVGADGLIVFTRTGAGASMRLLNADGSAAEVSGNGV